VENEDVLIGGMTDVIVLHQQFLGGGSS